MASICSWCIAGGIWFLYPFFNVRGIQAHNCSQIGAISDQYGRKDVLIFGNVIAIVGGVVCVTAKSIWVAVIGSTIIGLGSGCQSQSCAILSEMFKKKHRGILISTLGLLFITPLPFLVTGSLVGHAMAKNATWRWVYYLYIILTAVSGIMIFLFYYPPHERQLCSSWNVRSKLQALKDFDWIGALFTILFIVLISTSIVWVISEKYKWSSAAIIVPLVAAVVIMACLAAWETFGSKNPIFPHTMFINTRGFLFVLLAVTLATSGIASIDDVWPTEVSALYTTNQTRASVYILPSGFGTMAGALFAGLSMRIIRHTQLQFSATAFLGAIFVALMATLTPNNFRPGLAYIFVADFFGGAFKVISIVMIQLAFGDELIGTATGILNLARNIGPGLSNSFYVTIIRSRVSATLAKRVSRAVLPLGLPITSLRALLLAIASKDQAALSQIPGITPVIIKMAVLETELTYAAAFR
ncbi:MFS general substrate transporter [Lepidopterella palustris CBS 459.81]|uniref:MFS general substrate transporter n=1 Tax=Lepidopterella palustris CBS 459.81 TaxID=1314670 RepID=A0A8E2E0M3_9PEZI|nr:MFS general substrate transporter [Lepidopterella palustris CBS 459.81]